jgi:hypothetical protein
VINWDCREGEGEQSRHCWKCIPCSQIGVRSGVIMQEEDLIHLAVWPSP